MNALERFLNYVSVFTASDPENRAVTPSTPCQHELAKLLEQEMLDMGLENVTRTEHAYVYGFLPATPGYEHCKTMGFNAHIDLADDMGLTGQVRPQIIRDYDGGDIPLPNGLVIRRFDFPHLGGCLGKTIVTTDGTTVLGADDKAGVAAIMTMADRILKENIPHGRISLCFSPDEEIGHGASLLDLDFFGADYAFTVDGASPHGIESETFNAAAADIAITGVAVHPGMAKDMMINAVLVAMELNDMLPKGHTPRDTEEREGFWHLTDLRGSTPSAKMHYIIRDHDAENLLWRQRVLTDIVAALNEKYGEGTVKLTLKQEYRNMAEVVNQYPELLQAAEKAIRSVGLEPEYVAVRGGTDGAQLCFRGLPCPNLGAGGYGFHGPYEHLVAEELDLSVEILLDIVKQFAEK